MMCVIGHNGNKFLITSFPEPFMIRLQICVVSGLIAASPFIMGQIWGFVSPGLTAEEKKPLKWIAPLSVFLFFSGVILCYLILPVAYQWFASYIPADVEFRPSLQGSVLFAVKMLLAFGLVFELPIVLMLLAKVGIIDSKFLISNWRVAMVLISIVAAVITPSNDAFSMLMMATPVSGLYFVSIGLVKMAETRTYTQKKSLKSIIRDIVRKK